MSEHVRIKITPDDRMVEIPINEHNYYKNRVEVGLVLELTTYSCSEYQAGTDAEYVADGIVEEIKQFIKDKYGCGYNAIAVVSDGVCCHESELEEDE